MLKKTRIIILVIIMLISVGVTSYAYNEGYDIKTLETPYGKLTGELAIDITYNCAVYSETTCSKEAPFMLTKLEVQDQTGQQLAYKIDDCEHTSFLGVHYFGPLEDIPLAAWGTHEIRGKQGYAVYTYTEVTTSDIPN